MLFALLSVVPLVAVLFVLAVQWDGLWQRARRAYFARKARRIVRSYRKTHGAWVADHMFAAGPSHSGYDVLDATPGTVRVEMSDLLKVSLMQLNNFTAALRWGEPGGGGAAPGSSVQQVMHWWVEDALNTRIITDNTVGGQPNNANPGTLLVSFADANAIGIGDVLQDTSQSDLVAEQIQITSKTIGASTVLLGFVRAQNGTSAASHAQGATWVVIASPRPAGSNLGPDQSRSPILKNNFFQQHRRDVVITGELDELAKRGLTPGIKNMPAYQLHQRFWELLQDIERTLIRGKGTPGNLQDETQKMHGALSFLGYAPTPANSTATPLNMNGAPISDQLFSQVGINLIGQGADVPDWFVSHQVGIDRAARIFRDLLRVTQAEVIRGFTVDAVRMTMGHKLVRLLLSGYMPDPTVVEPVAMFLDANSWAIIPFYNRGMFLKTSPTMLDAKLVSLLSQISLEARNTGTDVGFRNLAVRNFTVN